MKGYARTGTLVLLVVLGLFLPLVAPASTTVTSTTIARSSQHQNVSTSATMPSLTGTGNTGHVSFWEDPWSWAVGSLRAGINWAQVIGGTFTDGFPIEFQLHGFVTRAYAATFGFTGTGLTSYPTSVLVPPIGLCYDLSFSVKPHGSKITLPTGTVQSIGIYWRGASAGNAMMALYSDNAGTDPYSLLSQSVSTPITTAEGWQDISITPHYVTAGTYWLVLENSVTKTVCYDTLGTNAYSSYTLAYGSFDQYWSTSPTHLTYRIWIRATMVSVEGYVKGYKFQYTDVTGGLVSSFSFYTSATGNFRLGFYTDDGGNPSKPSSLKWSSVSTAAAASTWNTVNESSGTRANGWDGKLTNNAWYWLMWQWDSVNNGPNYTAGTTNYGIYLAQSYGAFLLTWSGGTNTAEEWSMYLTYKASPTISTTLSPATIVAGGSAFDTAAMTGGSSAGGTASYYTYTDSACSTGQVLVGSAVTVTGGVVPNSAPKTFTSVGSFYWNVVYSGDANNNGATSPCETLTVNKASPTMSTLLSQTPIVAGGSVTDTATLSGGYSAGGTVSFYYCSGSTCTSGGTQVGSAIPVSSNSATSSAQVFGTVGTYSWRASYSGDSNNNAATTSSEGPLIVSKASPTISTAVSPSSITIGGSAADTATLLSGSSPTGTITFNAYSDSSCATGVFGPDAKALSSGSATSGSFTPASAGTYYWKASYGGDSNNNAVVSACQASGETLTVGKASPTLSTTLSSTSMAAGGSVHDTSVLSGASNGAGGTVTYNYYSGGTCGGTATLVSIVTVTGGVVPDSASQAFNTSGSFSWKAVYSGDGNNNGATSACEPLTVNPAALDHFTFDTISSPQTAGVSFSITIRAFDAYGNAVTSYISTNSLGASVGSVSPLNTAAFTGGVWTGSVTLTTAGSGVTMITSGGGKPGTSNPFNINPALTTMTVSYSIVGGGSGYSTPTFHYVQGGQDKTQALDGTPAGLSCDEGSAWSVTPNPLGGSTGSERWYSGQTLSGTASTQTLAFAFYYQYLQTLSYSVVGGGSPTAPTFTASRYGSSTPQVLTTSATGYWYDSLSLWSVTNPLGGSGGSEQWFTTQTVGGIISSATTTVLNYRRQFHLTMLVSPPSSGAPSPISSMQDAGTPVQISADPSFGYAFENWTCTGTGCYSGTDNPATITLMVGPMTESANFVGQATMTVSYQVSDGGAGYSAPAFNYVQGGQSRTYTLTGAAHSVPVDSGTVWSVTPNPLTGSGASERWHSSQTLSGTASTLTRVFTFYHQYLQTMSYSVVGGGSPAAPTFTADKNGASAPQLLTSTQTGYWFDSVSSWSVPNPLSDSGSERWHTTQSTSGMLSSSTTEVFTYQRQYMLTMLVDPPGAGSTTPSSGWQDAGTIVNATAIVTPGYGFQSWTGSGTGSYTGANNPANVTMSDETTETANFVGQSTMTVSYSISGGGTGYSPPAFNYVQGGASKQYVLTETPADIPCDGGSSWSVTPNPLSGSTVDERWYSDQVLSGGVSAQAMEFVFYHQYPLTLSYTTVGGGSGSSPPTFTASKNGTATPQVLTESATGYWYDSGSGWAVTSPLTGSGISEQWITSQSTSGTITSEQTTAFSYQHQYALTTQVSPGGAGTALPDSGWQTAGASIGISATANPGYTFQSWTGSGSGSYSGSNNPSSVTVDDATTETANFVEQVAMTVSYSVTGGGTGYSAPILDYVQGGSSMQYVLTESATGVQADTGSAWAVTPNPLTGSDASEQWISNQPLSGTISAQSIVFTYQNQYNLTLLVSPSGAGSTLPTSGWQNSDASIGFSVTANPGHTFFSWTGNGTGSYTGTDNPASVTMSAPITETANFALSVDMTVSYSVTGGGSGYSPPIFHYVQGGTDKTYTLTNDPTQLSVDSGTPWSVTPNPLSSSGSDERWYSNPPLSGIATGQTLEFAFEHQYMLTMAAIPSGGGTTTPATGWQNAGASIPISASAHPTYAFQDWSGSGSDSYSGSTNPSSVTMLSAVTETAEFVVTGPIQVTMTVSYSIAGGGSPTAPVFSYVRGGVSRQAILNQTAGGVQCDSGSAWSVTPNPLTGSDPSERWITGQTLSGTASTQSKVFIFQHKYYLTVQISPSGAGSATPFSGWQDAGALVHLSASANVGHAFQLWTGSGSGSYSGSNNPATVTLSGAVTETAGFTTGGPSPVGTACTFSSSASISVGAPVFSVPPSGSSLSPQQLLLPLSQVLPASGLVTNRRARRGMKELLLGGRHGGLSGLASMIVLVVLVASAIIGVAAYYYNIGSGAMSQPNMIFSGSVIKVNTASGTGTVYLKMYNEGSGSVRVRALNITANSGDFNLDFSSGMYAVVSAGNCNCTIAGGSGVGMGGSGGNGFLNLPAGGTTSIIVIFNSGMTDYFEPGTSYRGVVVPVQAAEVNFTVPSEGGQ